MILRKFEVVWKGSSTTPNELMESNFWVFFIHNTDTECVSMICVLCFSNHTA